MSVFSSYFLICLVAFRKPVALGKPVFSLSSRRNSCPPSSSDGSWCVTGTWELPSSTEVSMADKSWMGKWSNHQMKTWASLAQLLEDWRCLHLQHPFWTLQWRFLSHLHQVSCDRHCNPAQHLWVVSEVSTPSTSILDCTPDLCPIETPLVQPRRHLVGTSMEASKWCWSWRDTSIDNAEASQVGCFIPHSPRKNFSVPLIWMPEHVQSGSDSSSKRSKQFRISQLPEDEETSRR